MKSKSVYSNHPFIVSPLKSWRELEKIQEVYQIQIESCNEIWIEGVVIRISEPGPQVMKEKLTSSIELIWISSSMDESPEMLKARSTDGSIVKG